MFQTQPSLIMDWAKAIERNRQALKRIIAALVVLLGSGVERLPKSQYHAILRVLRPAESAVRRLIVIAARGLVVKPAPSRPMTAKPICRAKRTSVSFKLFDPRKTHHATNVPPPRVLPRIHVFGPDPRVAAIWAARAVSRANQALDDGMVNAQPIANRFQALVSALDNLPRQARRLARACQRRENQPALKFKSPLRPGPPPGHRKVRVHEIDEILAECHGLARDALLPNTS